MATDLTLYLDDQPGELARIGDVLGQAGANIAGLCAVASGGGQAEVHILVTTRRRRSRRCSARESGSPPSRRCWFWK